MKELAWSTILSTGIDEIDADHKRLIDLFNILNHAVAAGDNSTYIGAVLEELINCTAWHFSHEERLMVRYNYSDTESHKTRHRELMESIRNLQLSIVENGFHIGNEDIEFMEQWLNQHILTDDMKLGEYLINIM